MVHDLKGYKISLNYTYVLRRIMIQRIVQKKAGSRNYPRYTHEKIKIYALYCISCNGCLLINCNSFC